MTATYKEVFEKAKAISTYLPWKGRYKLIRNHLADKGIEVSDRDIRYALYGSIKNIDVLVAVIEIGKEKSSKVESVEI